MTEEVIIDGVNIAGCEYMLNNKIKGRQHCPAKAMPYAKETSCICHKSIDTPYNFCKHNSNCHYKQLKRLEQELKWANDEEKYLKDCCIKAGKELEKYSFKWDGKEKNLVVQALQLNQLYKKLEQENKSLYEEKNCLHKIIDRLLENAGYSKDIASAEDFEDVYEDMQIKRNELIELEQENKELKETIQELNKSVQDCNIQRTRLYKALEEIRDYINTLSSVDSDFTNTETYLRIQDKINECIGE